MSTHSDDALIVEGYPVHKPRFAGITIYATQVTTKHLQAAKRKEQAAAPMQAASGAHHAKAPAPAWHPSAACTR